MRILEVAGTDAQHCEHASEIDPPPSGWFGAGALMLLLVTEFDVREAPMKEEKKSAKSTSGLAIAGYLSWQQVVLCLLDNVSSPSYYGKASAYITQRLQSKTFQAFEH
jgi:hypothetical protein